MVHVHASPHHDESIATHFRKALSTALLDGLNRHLIAIALGLFPSSLFILRICLPNPAPHTHSYISYFLTSRLIRALLSISALIYFPLLALWTSIVYTIFTFLLRQTPAVERLLHTLCTSATTPVVDRLLALNSSHSDSSSLDLSDLRRELRHSAVIVRKREAIIAKAGRRSPLKGLVRILTDVGIAAGIAALAYVAETRFRDAVGVSSPLPSSPTNPNQNGSGAVKAATVLAADVAAAMGVDMGEGGATVGVGTGSKRLSRTVVIAILRTEMVSAVLLPFKASVKTYLYGTLVTAVVLLCGPVWMLW